MIIMSFLRNFLSTLPFINDLPPLSLMQQAHQDDYDLGIRGGRHSKPCRACNDFKSWVQSNNKQPNNKSKRHSTSTDKPSPDCPLDKDELGRNSWSLFHTMSAYYPDKPTVEEQESMKNLIYGLARFYPCETCAKDFQRDIQIDPPDTKSRKALSNWWCRIHNGVNKKLGKPEFDCSKLDQRWLDGWSDGSCD